MSDEEMTVRSMSNDDNDAKQKCNTCQPIVNGLLTFVNYIVHKSTDPNFVDVIGYYFDLEQVNDSKSLVCGAASLSLEKLDRYDIIQLFVVLVSCGCGFV